MNTNNSGGGFVDDIIAMLLPFIAVGIGGWAAWSFGREPLTHWAYANYLFTHDPVVEFPGAAIPGTGPTLTCLLTTLGLLVALATITPAIIRLFSQDQQPTRRQPASEDLPTTRPSILGKLIGIAAVTLAITGYIAAAILHVVDLIALPFMTAITTLTAALTHKALTRRADRTWIATLLKRELAPLLGFRGPGPRILAIRKWRDLTPIDITMTTAGEPKLAEISRTLTDVCGGATYRLSHDRRAATLTATLAEAAEKDDAERDDIVRLREIIADRTMFEPSAKLVLPRPDDNDDPDAPLSRFRVEHKITAKLAESLRPMLIERRISAILPGRWRAKWDHEHDFVDFEKVPEFPAIVSPVEHSGPELADANAAIANYPPRITYGVDADGTEMYWEPHKLPHTLVIGGTGSGKTATMHTIVTQVSRLQWPIIVFDFKGIEFNDFRAWPNVQMVVTEVPEAVAVVAWLTKLMRDRYELGTVHPEAAKNFLPMLIVFDEYTEFKRLVDEFYARTKGKGAPRVCPTIDDVNSMLRLARTARMHIVTGLQRPDTTIIAGEARDNYGNRISVGKLSEQGALMLWGDSYTGRAIPPGLRGRGMSLRPDGKPAETQFFFTPKPSETDPVAVGIVDAVRPSRASHDRLVVDPVDASEPAGFDEKGNPQWPDFEEFCAAELHSVADRPDLDPLSPNYHRVVSLRQRGVTGERGLEAFLKTPTPAETSRPHLRVVDNDADPDATEIDKHLGDVEIGDYILLDPSEDRWVIVDQLPIESPDDPGMWTILWRDGDEYGEIDFPEGTPVRCKTDTDPVEQEPAAPPAAKPAPKPAAPATSPWNRPNSRDVTSPQVKPRGGKSILDISIIGVAGSAGHETIDKYGMGRVNIGIAGEVDTAAIFAARRRRNDSTQLINGLKLPGGGDVDHALIRGNRVALLDSKRYSASTTKVAWDGPARIVKTTRSKVETQNCVIERAVKAYRKILGPDVQVEGWVVVHSTPGQPPVKCDNGRQPFPRLVAAGDFYDDVAGWLEDGKGRDVSRGEAQEKILNKLIAYMQEETLKDLADKGVTA